MSSGKVIFNRLYQFTSAMTGAVYMVKLLGEDGDLYEVSHLLNGGPVFLRPSKINKCHISKMELIPLQ